MGVIAVVAILFLLPLSVVYPDIRLSGSAYNETSFINSAGDVLYGNRSDLHLKAVSRSEGAKLVAELDFYTLHGYLAGADETASRLLKDGQFYIDRLYLKFPISRFDVILGKQRIAWGSGIVFRPTDNFNSPNPLSLSGRKEGVNALTTKVSIGALSSLDFIAAPADVFQYVNGEVNLARLEYGKFASRFTFNKFKTDMAFSYQYDGAPQNHIFGLDVKGDLGFGYHLETVFVYNRVERYWRSVMGLDYSFSGKWILMAEYLYNGSGRKEAIDLSESDFLLVEDFQYRHYVFSQVSYLHDVFLQANILLLWNLTDGSFITSPGIKYSLFQNTDLNLYSQIFFGDKGDEYGSERLGGDQIYYLKLTVKF